MIKKKFWLLIIYVIVILFISYGCTMDDVDIDYKSNLVNKTWIRHSFYNQDSGMKKFQEYPFKNEYQFYNDGTYIIKSVRWFIDTTSFFPEFDTTIYNGTWQFDEVNNIIDFTDVDTFYTMGGLPIVVILPDWYILEMTKSRFVVKYISDPEFNRYYKELFIKKEE